MKTPLRFQVAECDCCTMALLNAFSYLYKREEIPCIIPKAIYSYTLDGYDISNYEGRGGTSKETIREFNEWLNNYARIKKFNVKGEIYNGNDITENLIREKMEKEAVLLVRLWQEGEHYVTINKIDNEYVYIFDPYYLDVATYNKDADVELITTAPFSYNRKVKLTRLLSGTNKSFSIGDLKSRDILVITKTEGEV